MPAAWRIVGALFVVIVWFAGNWANELDRFCWWRVDSHLSVACTAPLFLMRTMAEQPTRAALSLCLKLVLPVFSSWPWRDDVCDGSCNVIAFFSLFRLWSGCQRETAFAAPNIVFAPRNSVGCNLVVTLLDLTSPAPCKHQALIVDCALCARCVAVLDVIWTSAQICCHCVPQCLCVSCKYCSLAVFVEQSRSLPSCRVSEQASSFLWHSNSPGEFLPCCLWSYIS